MNTDTLCRDGRLIPDAALLAALGRLCERFHVAQLDLFGSAAAGGFDSARSDIDLLVRFDRSGNDAYWDLLAALEATFGRKIDLIDDAAVANPYLRAIIDSQRQRLYPAA